MTNVLSKAAAVTDFFEAQYEYTAEFCEFADCAMDLAMKFLGKFPANLFSCFVGIRVSKLGKVMQQKHLSLRFLSRFSVTVLVPDILRHNNALTRERECPKNHISLQRKNTKLSFHKTKRPPADETYKT